MDVSHYSPISKRLNSCEIWMLSCTLMVVCALAEFGIILVIRFRRLTQSSRNNPKLETPTKHGKDTGNISDQYNDLQPASGLRNSTQRNNFLFHKNAVNHPEKRSEQGIDDTHFLRTKIDHASLVLFPITFFIFIFIYLFSCI